MHRPSPVAGLARCFPDLATSPQNVGMLCAEEARLLGQQLLDTCQRPRPVAGLAGVDGDLIAGSQDEPVLRTEDSGPAQAAAPLTVPAPAFGRRPRRC